MSNHIVFEKDIFKILAFEILPKSDSTSIGAQK